MGVGGIYQIRNVKLILEEKGKTCDNTYVVELNSLIACFQQYSYKNITSEEL